jgi:hypothetical protein
MCFTNLTRYSTVIFTTFAILTTTVQAFAGSGSFKGVNNHSASGGVSVEKRGDTYVIVLDKSFTFDGAPDPRIAFGNDGKFAENTDFMPLNSNKGSQEYLVPKSIDASKFSEVHIWCRRYSVDLAVAGLN